jgi:hypothetical protein
MAGLLFVTVLVGFSPTPYLRSLFHVPPVPSCVLVHRVVHTAWLVMVFMQATLVLAGRGSQHRRRGWLGAALGVVTG